MNKRIIGIFIILIISIAGVSIAKQNLNYNLPPTSDLECSGIWTRVNVEPGSTQSGVFYVMNKGDQGSLLNWEITEWPSWGQWSFSPSNGNNVEVGDNIQVGAYCTAPNVQNEEYTGHILVVNKDNPSDACIIPVKLSTQKNKFNYTPIQIFLEKHLYLKLLLQQIIKI